MGRGIERLTPQIVAIRKEPLPPLVAIPASVAATLPWWLTLPAQVALANTFYHATQNRPLNEITQPTIALWLIAQVVGGYVMAKNLKLNKLVSDSTTFALSKVFDNKWVVVISGSLLGQLQNPANSGSFALALADDPLIFWSTLAAGTAINSLYSVGSNLAIRHGLGDRLIELTDQFMSPLINFAEPYAQKISQSTEEICKRSGLQGLDIILFLPPMNPVSEIPTKHLLPLTPAAYSLLRSRSFQ